MSFLTTNFSNSHFSLADHVRLLVTTIHNRLVIWRHRQTITSELREYSPRELTELGISPSDIPHIAATVSSRDIR